MNRVSVSSSLSSSTNEVYEYSYSEKTNCLCVYGGTTEATPLSLVAFIFEPDNDLKTFTDSLHEGLVMKKVD